MQLPVRLTTLCNGLHRAPAYSITTHSKPPFATTDEPQITKQHCLDLTPRLDNKSSMKVTRTRQTKLIINCFGGKLPEAHSDTTLRDMHVGLS